MGIGERTRPVVSVKDLWKTYKSGARANRGIFLEMEPFELVCLMGPNGAGKTTLVRQVAGLLRPTSGQIEVRGVSVTARPREAKKSIGYQPQHLAGLSELTFREVLTLLGQLRGIPKDAVSDRVMETAAVLDVASVLEMRVGCLSGGYRKLLGVSLALLASPPVLLLDEPTAGLDPVHRRRVWQAIHRAREGGAAVLVTSHHLDEIEDHTDRYAIMLAGKIVTAGKLEDFVQEARREGRVAVRVFPKHGQEEAVCADLTAIGIVSNLDEEQRCHVLSIPRATLSKLIDSCSLESDGAIRGLSIDRGELETMYLETVERGRAHGA